MNDSVSFASENFSGAHPLFIEAISSVNKIPAPSYGNDLYTKQASKCISDAFDTPCAVHFAFNGTGANNFALSTIVTPFSAVFCSDVSHIYVDESTAPEAILQCRLYPLPTKNGKILIDALKNKLNRIGDIHHPQPSAITLSQPTECGTLYSHEELLEIISIAKKYQLKVHVDGARFFNAAVASGQTFREMVQGVNVLTLGGTKNGMLFGEAVVFFSPNDNIRFHLKRSMQLASKMRFISVQFIRMMENNLWHQLAGHANKLALYFADNLATIKDIEILYPVQTNAVFLKMPTDLYTAMQQYAHFYLWNEALSTTRLMFSFDNTIQQVDQFLHQLKAELEKS